MQVSLAILFALIPAAVFYLRHSNSLLAIWVRSTCLGWKPSPGSGCNSMNGCAPAQDGRSLPQLYHTRPLSGKRILVTGANRGLGQGLTAHLLALGADVIMACRSHRAVAESLPGIRKHLRELQVIAGGSRDSETGEVEEQEAIVDEGWADVAQEKDLVFAADSSRVSAAFASYLLHRFSNPSNGRWVCHLNFDSLFPIVIEIYD